MEFNTTAILFGASLGFAIGGLFGAAIGTALVTGVIVATTLYVALRTLG
jgi:hypothetical protein